MNIKRSLWLAAVAALPLIMPAQEAGADVIDFDAIAAGTAVTTVGGVSITATDINAFALDLVVSDLFDTDSGENYLGVDDGGFEVFLPGDTITLDFVAPITMLTVSFITTPIAPDEVSFSIETAVGIAMSSIVGPDQ